MSLIGNYLDSKKRKKFLSFLERHSAVMSTDPIFTDDPELMLEAAKKRGYNLKLASPRLKNDYEFMLEAVKINGLAIEFGSDLIRDNKVIALEAVKSYGYAIKYVSDRLKSDIEVAKEAVKVFGDTLQYIPNESQTEDLVLSAVKDSGNSLRWASKEFIDNKKIALTAIKDTGMALSFVSKRLKSDTEVVFAALIQNPSSIAYVPKKFQSIMSGLDPYCAGLKLKELYEKGHKINLNINLEDQFNKITIMEDLTKSLGESSNKTKKIKI